MKRIFRTLGLIAMVALVATSCKKKEERTSFDINFGEVKGLQAGPDIFETKAYVDPQGVFRWIENDEVMVYNLDEDSDNSECAIYTADANSEGQTRVRFTGPSLGTQNSEGYFIFHGPNKAAGAVKGNDNVETFTVSNTQNYIAKYNMDPTALAMACTTGEAAGHVSNFTVKHVFGLLNVGIGSMIGNKQVTSIKVEDAAWNLTGMLDIKLTEVDSERFTSLMNLCESTNGGETYLAQLRTYLGELEYNAHGERDNFVTLNCGNAAIGAYWKYFYISLRPGALYKGFTITITTNDNTYVVPVQEDIRWLIKPATFRNIYICLDNTSAGYTVYKDW